MIFDTHAHYDDESFDIDRDKLLSEMELNNVGKIVTSGASFESNEKIIEIIEKYKNVYASFGIHPEYADKLNEENFAEIKKLCEHKKCVAVGEIGLDYYYDEPDREIQKIWFERQLELAREIKKPVVIHSREAALDTMNILKGVRASEIGGIMHCYSYSKEIAKELVDLGMYLGIGGVVTFKNGKKLKEVVEYIPMEHLVLETDSPYLTPVPFRGKRNNSSYISYVVREIALIKGISEEEVERITYNNALKIYGLRE